MAVRALSEAERDRAIRELRETYAQGTLTDDEFDERVGALLSAHSRAELDDVLGRDAEVDSGCIARSDIGPTDLRVVERHLSSSERVEWAGRPDPALFTRSDVVLVPFSVVWAGLAIFWEITVILTGGGPFLVIWGIPFVLVGLYITVGRFFFSAVRRRRTLYVVTNRRVMRIRKRRAGEAVEAVELDSLPSMVTRATPHGRGKVEFGIPFRGERTPLTFQDIKNPESVADLVDRLRGQERRADGARWGFS